LSELFYKKAKADGNQSMLLEKGKYFFQRACVTTDPDAQLQLWQLMKEASPKTAITDYNQITLLGNRDDFALGMQASKMEEAEASSRPRSVSLGM
jgi:hypothetical protein